MSVPETQVNLIVIDDFYRTRYGVHAEILPRKIHHLKPEKMIPLPDLPTL